MINGIIIFEQGGIQQLGELHSLQGVIDTIKKILPDLEAQEANRILEQISDEDLAKIVAARENKKEVKAATGKTERLK